ncbi:MAG TPA: hypothetical protein VK961_06980 [Chthoniobacter sp.]|nr:hypothetical protein [Chthoniobacter sp.]
MLKAKFICNEVAKNRYQQEVAKLSPVYGSGEENKSFSDATPCGSLELTISNKAAHGFFAPGKEYYLDITPAEAPAEVTA